MSAVYLDASAVVKLALEEAESSALRAWLGERRERTSSEIVEVEARCTALRRRARMERTDTALESIGLVALHPDILRRAGEPFDPPQRTLDAIHLATALRARDVLDVFVTYDAEQAAAARALGFEVASPGR